MYYLLIFLIFAFIGLIIYLKITKRKIMKFIIITALIIFSTILLIGFRFTASSVLPPRSIIIDSIKTNYGKVILFENKNDNSFGIVKVNQYLGFLYSYSGGNIKYPTKGNIPFHAAGYGSNEKEGFIIGVRISDPNIRYIVVGNHLENIMPSDKYILNLDTIKKYSDKYHIKEVTANYALFVLDNYSEETWTIRAFESSGNLVAAKLFGTGEASYIDNY